MFRIELDDYYALVAAAPEVGGAGGPPRDQPARRAQRPAGPRVRTGAGPGRSSSAVGGTPPVRSCRRFLDRNQIRVQMAPAGRARRRGAVAGRAARRGRPPRRSRRERQDRRATAASAGGRAPRHPDRAGGRGVRHGDRRRGACRPGGRRVRRVRGAPDDRDRARGTRRPGGHVVADRELPRLPLGRIGRRAVEPGAPAGAQARRRDPRHEVDHPHRRRDP